VEPNVIPFPKKQKPRVWGEYFCLKCEHNDFRLSQCGEITCGNCGSLMRNIYVTEYPPEGL
jgi:DNA-directed RNA polymerase subunit RPC12/RpoP